MHTKQAIGDDMKVEFKRWKSILDENARRLKNKQPLIAPLIDFQSDVKGVASAD